MAVAELARKNPFESIQEPDAGQRSVRLELAGLLIFGGLVFWVKECLKGELQTAAWVLVGAVFLVVAYRNLAYGLWALVIAIGLSPDSVGAPNVRLEDYMLPALLLLWWIRHNERHESLVRTDVFFNIRLYMAVVTISTIRAWTVDQVFMTEDMLWEELTWKYYFKYLECFIIFWLVLNNIKDKADLSLLLVTSMFTCAVVGIAALRERQDIITAGTSHLITRVRGPSGETPNILGGYFMLHIMMAFAMLFVLERPLHRALLLCFLAAVAMPMLFTYSRTSFLSLLIGLLVTMLFLDIRYAFILLGLALFIPILFPLGLSLLPEHMGERYASIFNIFTPDIFTLDLKQAKATGTTSWAARVLGWYSYYTAKFMDYPFLGKGMGSIWLGIDNDFVKKFFESGLLGLSAFLLLLQRLFRTALEIIRESRDSLYKAVGIGFIGGLAGMMVHAVGACSFSSIRIAELFWVFSGFLVAAHFLVRRDRELSAEDEDDASELVFSSPEAPLSRPGPAAALPAPRTL